MTGRLHLLSVPWAGVLLDKDARVEVQPGQTQSMPAPLAMMMFSDDAGDVEVDGTPRSVDLVATLKDRTGSKQKIWSIAAHPSAGAERIIWRPGWSAPAKVRFLNGLSQPGRSPGGAATDDDGTPCAEYLRLLAGRIEEVREAVEAGDHVWPRIYETWTTGKAAAGDPQMAIIVRHAKQHGMRWRQLTTKARSILARRHRMLPVDRTEDLDQRCLQWLASQPGRTMAERAGPRQEILSLARTHSLDTLENRVFRDLLERSAQIARAYVQRTSEASRSERAELVRRYGAECSRCATSLHSAGVTRLVPPVQPNNVLQSDTTYRQVWSAWSEVVRMDRTADNLWRWQHAAWRELCLVAVVASLCGPTNRTPVAASPLGFREEQRNGRWLLHDNPLAVLINPASDLVVEILDGRGSGITFPEFGATAWLRIGGLDGGFARLIPIWALHDPRGESCLDQLAESASRAIRGAAVPSVPRGLVIRSLTDAQAEADAVDDGRVAAISLGPTTRQMSDGMTYLACALTDLIGDHG